MPELHWPALLFLTILESNKSLTTTGSFWPELSTAMTCAALLSATLVPMTVPVNCRATGEMQTNFRLRHSADTIRLFRRTFLLER